MNPGFEVTIRNAETYLKYGIDQLKIKEN